MKGGITSAIVYPPAIQELQKRYTFRGVGGASAGAIAAAATACAELGRASGGFERLGEIETETRDPRFLLKRFVPAPALAPLFAAFCAFLEWRPTKDDSPPSRRPWQSPGFWERMKGRVGAFFSTLWSSVMLLDVVFKAGPVVCTALAVGGGLLALWGASHITSQSWLLGVVFFVGALVGATLAAARLAWLAVALNDKNAFGFGTCPGSLGEKCTAELLGDPARVLELPLTDWLHARLNGLAGLPPDGPSPTFKQLKQGELEVKLMTTDVSLELPMLLPSNWGARSFFYRAEELGKLFPAPVMKQLREWNEVDELRRAGREAKYSFLEKDKSEMLRLPLDEDMPLLVAVRMSLSFPVLLRAVRLYSLHEDAYGPTPVDLDRHVQEHWFSDGGIGSNFPIHVFDSWVPTRPTFGITLLDASTAERERVPESGVELPTPQSADKARPRRVKINGLASFLGGVFETAKNFRDTLQSCLPSYRERIVQVFLSGREGGLNLTMKDAELTSIIAKGALAGRTIVERYNDGESFEHHQWVRIRVLLGALEEEFGALKAVNADFVSRFDALLNRANECKWYLAEADPAKAELLRQQVRALSELIRQWSASGCDPARPTGHLRVAPEL